MAFGRSKTAAAGPPPPPPPPPPSTKVFNAPVAPKPPNVTENGPPGACMVELVIYNGAPFKNHWAYYVRSRTHPEVGVLIHATGDVRNGFILEFKRYLNFKMTSNKPMARIPLQWVDGRYFDEAAMLNINHGGYMIDRSPVCAFEACASKVKAPKKTLISINNGPSPRNTVKQRNCQTWIVEAADQLVRDGIFNEETAAYIHNVEQ